MFSKQGIGILVLLLCLTVLSVYAQTPSRTITIINAAALDAEQMKELVAFLNTTLNLPLREISLEKLTETDMLSLGRSLAAKMTSNDVCFVALSPGREKGTEFMVAAPDNNWAVINVGALKAGGPKASVFVLRVERQVMRSLAFLFGVGYTPDPHGVNRPFSSVEELDTMGSNFPPPSTEAFYAEASQRGLSMLIRRPTRRKPGSPSSVPSHREDTVNKDADQPKK